MELWTEYEGLLIDGAFPLRKLLLPEGRSAFFSTTTMNGEPTVIRLIASHFDEEEILARWRGVRALGHPNILKLEQFGQLELDDTTVVYAVMEPVDANLAEVIGGHRLPVSEVRQLASSLVSALDVLHTNGFVHEHVEPANIYAVGETVKLRGDCIRETPEGEAGVETRKHDIHNLGVVLLQACGQHPPFETTGVRAPLPAPFDLIIPNAIRGAWTLEEIKSVLGFDSTSTVLGPNLLDFSAIPASAVQATAHSEHGSSFRSQTTTARPSASTQPNLLPDELSESEGTNSQSGRFKAPEVRSTYQTSNGLPRTKTRTIWAAVALVTLLIVWLIWHSVRGSQKPAPISTPIDHSASATTPTLLPVPENAKPSAAGRIDARTAPTNASGSHEQWRVVAFTYNYRDQAQKKATTIAQKHPDLHAEVFTPTGRAPFLVTIGGPMGRDAAHALARRVGKWGLPGDTYAQNYDARQR